jgi:hypothetical protein
MTWAVASMSKTPQQAARRLAAGAIRDGFKADALHEYRDTIGATIYWRIHLKHPDGRKWIRPMYVNGNGYELGEPTFPTGKKPLYALYALDRMVGNPDEVVWIVEGEQKVDALTRLGLAATTSGSATSARAANWEPLGKRIVVIWPDNDDPGKTYAREVASIVIQRGCAVSCIDVDQLGPEQGEDVMHFHGKNRLSSPLGHTEIRDRWRSWSISPRPALSAGCRGSAFRYNQDLAAVLRSEAPLQVLDCLERGRGSAASPVIAWRK